MHVTYRYLGEYEQPYQLSTRAIIRTCLSISVLLKSTSIMADDSPSPGVDDIASPRVSGSKARYNVVRKYFNILVMIIENHLQKFATKLFSNGLIEDTDLENSKISSVLEYDKASDLLLKVLRKIESKQGSYEIFVSVLREFSDKADELDAALKKEDPTTFTALFRSPVDQQLSEPTDIVCSGSSIRHLEANSEVSASVRGDSLTEESETTPNSVAEASVQNVSLLVASQASSGSAETTPTYSTLTGIGQEKIVQATTIRTSSDQTVPTPSHLKFNSREYWTWKAENDYLKSENEWHANKVAYLEKVIETLEENRVDSSKKLEKLEEEINNRDEEIQKFKIHLQDNSKHIEALQTEVQSGAEEETKLSSEVKLKEAKIDLDNATEQYSEAKSKKQEEVSKLREQFHKDEIIKQSLKFNLQILNEETKREKSEMREKHAQQEADRAKEEAARAKEEADHAKEEAQKANNNLKMSEAEVERCKSDQAKNKEKVTKFVMSTKTEREAIQKRLKEVTEERDELKRELSEAEKLHAQEKEEFKRKIKEKHEQDIEM